MACETEDKTALLKETEITSKRLKKKLNKKKLSMEESKTEAIIIDGKKNDLKARIEIDETVIETVEILKYLGFYIINHHIKIYLNHCGQTAICLGYKICSQHINTDCETTEIYISLCGVVGFLSNFIFDVENYKERLFLII